MSTTVPSAPPPPSARFTFPPPPSPTEQGMPLHSARSHDADGSAHHHLSPLRRLLAIAALEREDLWAIVVYATAVGLVSLAAPIGVQSLVNTIAFGTLYQPLVALIILVFALLTFAGVLKALEAFVIERVQQRLFARVALDLGQRLPRVAVRGFDGAHGPELANRFFDVLTLQKGAATLLAEGLAVALGMLGGLVILSFYHPALLAFDLLLLCGLGVVVFGLGRGGTSTAIDESMAKYEVAAWIEEMTRHPTAFKLAGGSRFAGNRELELTRRYLRKRQTHFRIVYRQHVGSLVLSVFAMTALLGVGGVLVIQRQLTLGQLVAAEIIVAGVAQGLEKLGKVTETYFDIVAAADKLGYLIDLPLERTKGEPLPVLPHGLRVELRDVTYEFENGARALDGVNLVVRPGARIAVAGPEGSGKSTLGDILYGLREPTSGAVDINGVDLRDLAKDTLREQVAFVKGTEVFAGTIEDNVRVGRPHVGLVDVRHALECVGLWAHVSSLPDGLQTVVQTDGRPLSDGQARRLTFARAIAGRPRLLIVDGPLEDLPEDERRPLLYALIDPKAPWSLVFTQSSREVHRFCEQLYVMKRGRLVADDTDDEPSPAGGVS